MRKTALWLTGVSSSVILAGCSHQGMTEEYVTSAHHLDMVMKLASVMDSRSTGSENGGISVIKQGNKLTVRRCEKSDDVSLKGDCHATPGMSVAQVPIEAYKVRLTAALRLPVDYTRKPGEFAELKRQRAEVQKAIQQIRSFVGNHAEGSIDVARIRDFKKRLRIVEGKLFRDSELSGIVLEVDSLIDKATDLAIGGPALRRRIFSEGEQSLEFNILSSYIRSSGISAKFVGVPAGSFQMGSPTWEVGRLDNDEAIHHVTITRDFEIQQTEVTQAHWFWVMGYNPSRFRDKKDCPGQYLEINGMGLCPNHPIEQVSWSEMQEFIKVLNGIGDGYVYRFPTEAEWEYAARGGTQTAYFFGNDARKLSDYGWYKENSGGQTHAVGEKRANQFGLYDIYGNVWEWVQDWYGEYPVGNQRDPSGSASGPGRVVRGGRWLSIAECLRSADRFFVDPREGRSSLGFRLVRVRK